MGRAATGTALAAAALVGAAAAATLHRWSPPPSADVARGTEDAFADGPAPARAAAAPGAHPVDDRPRRRLPSTISRQVRPSSRSPSPAIAARSWSPPTAWSSASSRPGPTDGRFPLTSTGRRSRTVQLEVPVFVAGDGRRLGARLQRVPVRPRDRGAPGLALLALFAAPAVLAAAVGRRAGLRPSAPRSPSPARSRRSRPRSSGRAAWSALPTPRDSPLLIAVGLIAAAAFAWWVERAPRRRGPLGADRHDRGLDRPGRARDVAGDDRERRRVPRQQPRPRRRGRSLSDERDPARAAVPLPVRRVVLRRPRPAAPRRDRRRRAGPRGGRGRGRAGFGGAVPRPAVAATGAAAAGLAVVLLQTLPATFDVAYSYGNLSNAFGQSATVGFFAWWAGAAPGGWAAGAFLLAIAALAHFSSLIVGGRARRRPGRRAAARHRPGSRPPGGAGRGPGGGRRLLRPPRRPHGVAAAAAARGRRAGTRRRPGVLAAAARPGDGRGDGLGPGRHRPGLVRPPVAGGTTPASIAISRRGGSAPACSPCPRSCRRSRCATCTRSPPRWPPPPAAAPSRCTPGAGPAAPWPGRWSPSRWRSAAVNLAEAVFVRYRP